MSESNGSNEGAATDFFICIREREGTRLPGPIRMGNDLNELVAWATGAGEPLRETDEPQTDQQSDPSSPLGTLMAKIVDSGHQQYEMTKMLSVMRNVLPDSMMQNQVIDGLLKDAEQVVRDKSFRIIRIDDHVVDEMGKAVDKVIRLNKGLSNLPNAVLLSMVATFDSQMSDVVRAMLGIRTDKLKAGERHVSLSRIMGASSLSEIIEEAVSDEVYQFSRNGHDEQIKYIEDNFDISIRKSWKRWPDLIEVFETRNLVAHGERNYTKRYVSICTKHGHKGSEKALNTPIRVSSNYLRQSLNTLTEFSILLIFSLWRKHAVNDEVRAFESLNTAAFELIANGRSSVAVFICEFALSLNNTTIKEATRLMFVVNLASAHMHMKKDDLAYKVLDKVDWSATSDNFKICVAALRKSGDEVARLLPMIKAAGSIAPQSFREWPAFDFIKKDKTFIEAFEANFGQRFDKRAAKKLEEVAVTLDEGDTTDLPASADTTH